MAKPYVEADVRGKKILRVDAPFDVSLVGLRSEGVQNPMTAKELAIARTYHPEGKQSSLMTRGSYTKAGFAYMKGENPIRVADSPLLDSSLAEKATQANRENRYFATESAEMYERMAKLAKEDKNKEPEKRRAIVLPSRDSFQISPTKNPEVFVNIFGNAGKKYLEFLGFDNLTVYPVDKNVVDAQNGTILTQEWLARLGVDSNVNGSDRSLSYNATVRGVQLVTGEASSQKTDGLVLHYTREELDGVVRVLEGVRSGIIPASKLERAIKFAKKLRGN